MYIAPQLGLEGEAIAMIICMIHAVDSICEGDTIGLPVMLKVADEPLQTSVETAKELSLPLLCGNTSSTYQKEKAL